MTFHNKHTTNHKLKHTRINEQPQHTHNHNHNNTNNENIQHNVHTRHTITIEQTQTQQHTQYTLHHTHTTHMPQRTLHKRNNNRNHKCGTRHIASLRAQRCINIEATLWRWAASQCQCVSSTSGVKHWERIVGTWYDVAIRKRCSGVHCCVTRQQINVLIPKYQNFLH
jgi:hypothetical protein